MGLNSPFTFVSALRKLYLELYHRHHESLRLLAAFLSFTMLVHSLPTGCCRLIPAIGDQSSPPDPFPPLPQDST